LAGLPFHASGSHARIVMPKSIYLPSQSVNFLLMTRPQHIDDRKEVHLHSVLWLLILWKPCTWYISCVWKVQIEREFRA